MPDRGVPLTNLWMSARRALSVGITTFTMELWMSLSKSSFPFGSDGYAVPGGGSYTRDQQSQTKLMILIPNPVSYYLSAFKRKQSTPENP